MSDMSAEAPSEQELIHAYRELMEDVTLPDDQQTRNFAEYVAGAHSWYKHLPPLAPGRRFAFYLDRDAGRERETLQNGRSVYIDRTADTPFKFHYTWMTTAAYRKKFGFWNYGVSGPSAMMSTQPTTRGEWEAWYHLNARWPLLLHRAGWVPLPRQITRVSECFVTNWIHDASDSHWMGAHCHLYLAEYYARRAIWPDDPDVVRYQRLADRFSAAYGGDRSPEVWQVLDGEARRFWETERPLMRQRIFNTMLAARAATERFLASDA
jgi:hypothetical protein